MFKAGLGLGRNSRLFFYGEKREGENLGFECQANTISELKEFENYQSSWEGASTGVDKIRGQNYHQVEQRKVEYEQIISRIKFMVSGRSHSFIVTTENELYCCGYNAYVQCGCGESTDSVPYLERIDLTSIVEPLIEKGLIDHHYEITKIACGWVHSVIVINDKYLFGAGHNFFYQTGIPTSGTFGRFTYIPLDNIAQIPPDYKITQIDGGTFFTLFAINNRTVFGSGSASLANFGIKSNDNIQGYQFVREFDCDIEKLQAGYDHTLIKLRDKRIFITGKMEGTSSDVTVDGFKELDIKASTQDSIDIAVCRFNYKSYVLKNDTLHSLNNGVPEIVKSDKRFLRANLFTSNLSLMIIDSTKENIIETRTNNGDKLFDLEIPQGFKVDHISAGYTAIYLILKPKSSHVHFFNKLKDAAIYGKLADIVIN